MHCKAAMVMGSRMQHGSAQPTAAHALQGKRNARVCSLELRCHHFTILFLVFSSDVIISPYSLEMSPQNSASHFTLPRTQACFPRPIVLFCLGDGISLTASAYRGIQSNANSADRNVTHNLVVVFSSVKLKSKSFFL